MRVLFLIAVLAMAFAVAPSAAQETAARCRAITDSAERLKCFDEAADPAPEQRPAPPPKKKAGVLTSAQKANSQNALVARLEHTFLSKGIDLSVYSMPQEGRAVMLVWGYQSRATVYQLLLLHLLEMAKDAGFDKVDFFDKGAEGHWIFDLTGATIPRCDVRRRICRND